MSKRQRFGKRDFFRAVAWCLALVCLLCGAMVVAAHQQRKHFAQEVQGRLDQLAKVEVGRTSRAEVLASIPELKPVLATSGEFYVCNRNPDCVIVSTDSSRWLHWITQSNKLNWIVERTHSGRAVGFIFRMAGVELGWTRLSLTFSDGRVEYWSYEIIATNHAGDPITLNVFAAPEGANVFMEGRPHDENFDFWVDRIHDNWGDSAQKVVFAPAASGELKRVALHPDLTCLQSYRGCETAKQLIPGVLAADRQIRETSVARLKGPVPCPDRILRSYANHASWIATAEVASVRDDPTEAGVQLIQLRSVVSIKGVPRDVDREISMWSYSMVSEQKAAPNRVASLAKPGNKVILLDVGAGFFTDDACTTIPASEENLRVVQQQN